MNGRRTPARGGPLASDARRDALFHLLAALDIVLEEGISPPDARRPDASLRTCALEIAFGEADALVTRLGTHRSTLAPISQPDADRLIAAAASICVWGRAPDCASPSLDRLADAVARIPGAGIPLAQLA